MSRLYEIALLLCLFSCSNLNAATYCIDYEAGSDQNNGTSPQTAWKHCPGDDQANDRALACQLNPGDIIRFKGGVHYCGTINIKWSGSEGQAIRYDGNSDGNYGKGKAIIQGADPLSDWKKVASATDVAGNKHWKEMFYHELDASYGFFSFTLYQDDIYLPCAQFPKPKDPFYHDVPATYFPAEKSSLSSISDSVNLKGKSPDFFKNAWIAMHVRPNKIHYTPITSFDANTSTLGLQGGKGKPKLYNQTKYSMMNSPHYIDNPGEYYLEFSADGKTPSKLYLLPAKSGSVENIRISKRRNGFIIQQASHVTIDGFQIHQQGGDRSSAISHSGSASAVITNISILNNEIARVKTFPNRSGAILMSHVHHSLISNNHIYENPYCAGLMLTHFDHSECSDNKFIKNGSTAVDYYNCHHSTILRNVVRDNHGMHANGLTMYVGCTHILVEGNRVHDANGVTTNEGSDITIRNNIFDGGGHHTCMGMWASPPLNNVHIVNNIIIRGGKSQGGIYMGNAGTGWVIKNNIIDGFTGKIQAGTEVSNNIYTSLRSARPKLGADEYLVEDLRLLFTNLDQEDYTPPSKFPGAQLGIDLKNVVPHDIDNKARPQGKAMDIGAYER